MTYEMVSMPGYALEPRSNPVHFRVSDDGLDWGDPKTEYPWPFGPKKASGVP
jgi:hypothetical protein